MTVRATWKGITLAESDHTILVEGNQYFPPGDVARERLQESDTHTHCPWKGDASYYNVVLEADANPDAAWYYPSPYPAAERIAGYVAFWRGVEVSGSNPDTPEVRPPAR